MELGRSSSSGGGSVTLTWSQPTERVNGSPLTDDDISGYTIRYRSSSNVSFNTIFVENCRSNSCTYKVEDLSNPSEYDFQVAAVDSVGLHSEFVSAEN
ncbi:MAG: fibronectin type III domain-containing protein [Natronospirillum sp.]|uniref:fibronectin type III domain-containing protein n=1 Tax=Natronospirillum sp. TaxID=2812955 RepID=UPI0025DA59C6|nr:fibronectin type III domain-containing protein [Natronospirillum sp.]MCH8551549.1 fibronectin type III domain-containing protein [Natronospirillum sp.]